LQSPIVSLRKRRTKPIYTGWRIVAITSVIWALQSMLWMQGYGNLAVELRNRFGWSKTFLSIVYAVTRSLGAVIGPLHGRMLEHRGITTVMRVGAVLTMMGFLGLSQIDKRGEFVVVMIVASLGSSLMGFLTLTTATVQWFERRRSLALSIQTMGLAIGGFAGPLLVVGFATIGWRWTIGSSGVLLGAAAWLASGRIGQSPSSSDEPMDGLDPETAEAEQAAEGVSDDHFTLAEAIRTRAFWMISLGHGSALLVVGASMAHLALYLTEDRGFSAGRAALIAGIVPVFQLVGTGIGGYLGDRINKRLIAGVAMSAHAIGLLVLTWIESSVAIGVFVVLHGTAWGVRGPQMQAIRADYFGTTSFARIMGWSAIVVTAGSVSGPLLAGILADSTGNYKLGFTLVACTAFAGTIFWVLATPPKNPNALIA
jgi:MFS family permease